MINTSDNEIEMLRKLRNELENRIAVIEAKQKTLEEETKGIRQKAAIRELLRSVRRRRDELAGLPIQRTRLEDK